MTTPKLTTEKGDCQPLSRKFFKQAEAHRLTYVITPAAGTTIKRILKRDYWTNIAAVLTKNAMVIVIPEDSEYYAELIVVAYGKNWADMVVRGDITYLDASKPIPDDSEYFIRHRGIIAGWAVVRKSDKQIVKGEFQSAALAKQWLEQYENKTIA